MKKIDQLIHLINKYQTIIIFGHVNCDGDCFSSQIAMYEFIKNNFSNKEVYIVGSGVRKMFSLFYKPHIVNDDKFKGSLAIALDFNEDYRCEDTRLFNCKEIAVIDHHNKGKKTIKNASFCYINNSLSSCALALYILFKQNKNINMTPTLINALYYGIVSDTNRFMYLEKDAKSLTFAKKLIKLGANFEKIYQNIALSNFNSFNIKSYIYSHYKVEGKIIYCVIDKNFIASLNYDGYIGSFVNVLANLEGFDAWALFIENKDNTLTCEFRSHDKPIIPVAIKFGGGGHDFACGIQKIPYEKDIISSIIKEMVKVLS